MSEMVMLPGMLCGDYPEVKKKVAVCVRRAVAPGDVVAALQETLVRSDTVTGLLLVESSGVVAPQGKVNYWCDALMIELDRKHKEVADVRAWCYDLLTVPWGGLTFLSQEANGVLGGSRELCVAYVRWMISNAEALDALGERFSLSGRQAPTRLWSVPTNLAGALGALGATNDELRASARSEDYCRIARRVLGDGASR